MFIEIDNYLFSFFKETILLYFKIDLSDYSTLSFYFAMAQMIISCYQYLYFIICFPAIVL